MWIQNVSMSDIRQGFHITPGINSMLIQIVDPAYEFPVPKYEFREVHQFEFLDAEDKDNFPDECKCTDEQAKQLVDLLLKAYGQRMNVIVHCHAGVCRSGAVAEIGVMLGFDDTEAFRSPNLLVKHKMMKALGWTYDEAEPHTINGVEWGLEDSPTREGDV
jgi:predicted protein tyrosine phosphatase